MKRGKIEGFVMDSRTMMRGESEDDSRLRNLSYFAQSSLAQASITQMSLPRLTFLCHLSSLTSIYQIPELCSLTNPMQPLISRWYNPDKRCDVMVGSSTISSEQFQELQDLSLKVGEQETSGVGEGGCHWLYCSPNIFRMTC